MPILQPRERVLSAEELSRASSSRVTTEEALVSISLSARLLLELIDSKAS